MTRFYYVIIFFSFYYLPQLISPTLIINPSESIIPSSVIDTNGSIIQNLVKRNDDGEIPEEKIRHYSDQDHWQREWIPVLQKSLPRYFEFIRKGPSVIDIKNQLYSENREVKMGYEMFLILKNTKDYPIVVDCEQLQRQMNRLFDKVLQNVLELYESDKKFAFLARSYQFNSINYDFPDHPDFDYLRNQLDNLKSQDWIFGQFLNFLQRRGYDYIIEKIQNDILWVKVNEYEQSLAYYIDHFGITDFIYIDDAIYTGIQLQDSIVRLNRAVAAVHKKKINLHLHYMFAKQEGVSKLKLYTWFACKYLRVFYNVLDYSKNEGLFGQYNSFYLTTIHVPFQESIGHQNSIKLYDLFWREFRVTALYKHSILWKLQSRINDQ